MTSLTADRIRDHATKLGLTHLVDVLTQLVERAEAAQMGYLDFVDLLLEEEIGLREGRRFRNALKLSGLPHHKTLDDFDFAFQPDLDVRKVVAHGSHSLADPVAALAAWRALRGQEPGPVHPNLGQPRQPRTALGPCRGQDAARPRTGSRPGRRADHRPLTASRARDDRRPGRRPA